MWGGPGWGRPESRERCGCSGLQEKGQSEVKDRRQAQREVSELSISEAAEGKALNVSLVMGGGRGGGDSDRTGKGLGVHVDLVQEESRTGWPASLCGPWECVVSPAGTSGHVRAQGHWPRAEVVTSDRLTSPFWSSNICSWDRRLGSLCLGGFWDKWDVGVSVKLSRRGKHSRKCLRK